MQIEKLMNDSYVVNRKGRSRLGLSQIGSRCPRVLWFAHHGCPQSEINGRMLRLFHLGEVIEDVVIRDLERIGLQVTDRQKQIVINEHLRGSCDGIVHGLMGGPMLLEVKSANDKKFAQLVRCGSYESWNHGYAMQIQAYMYGLGLNHTLAVVYNKNTSELYTEIVKADTEKIVSTIDDVCKIIALPEPPRRDCPLHNPEWCSFFDTCYA